VARENWLSAIAINAQMTVGAYGALPLTATVTADATKPASSSEPTRLSTLMPVSFEIARIGWSRAFIQFRLFQIILPYIFILRLSPAGLGIAS
jgi:hypothetical protein